MITVESTRAKRLFMHYMRMLAESSGTRWDSDNDAEVADIVDCIIKAAAAEGARQALQALSSSMME